MGDNFGYKPPNLPYEVTQYMDYVGSQPTVDYSPTAWDDYNSVNIDTMWAWVSHDSDERTTAVADMWRRVKTLLDATHQHLQRHGDALFKKWTGDAANSFKEHLGAAMFSLEEWGQAADSSARALDDLAKDISTAQNEVRKIWQRYTQDFANAKSAHEAADKESNLSKFGDWLTGDDHGPTPDDVRKQATNDAKPHMKKLADSYMQLWERLDRGTTYRGPTNATVATGGAPPGGLPPRPAGPPPGAPPGGLGAPPPAPPGGTQGPPPPAPPPGTTGVVLAGGVVAPPGPPPPAPTGLPSVPGGGALGPPPTPPPGFPPGLAGGVPGRGPAPARPTGLPGEGEPGRGAPPSRPNLSGRGRPPARPGLSEPGGQGRGGAPGRPNLRGNTAGRGRAPGRPGVSEPESEGRSGRPGAPGSRNPLRGSRGGAPTEPEGRGRGAPAGRGGPGGRARPGNPNLERGPRPGSVPEEFESSRGPGGAPRLTGRRGGVPASPEEARGSRSGPFGSRPGAEAKRLGGRRGPDRPGELSSSEQEAFSRRTPERPDLTRRLSMRRAAGAEPSSELGGRRNPAPNGRQPQQSEPPRQGKRRRSKDEPVHLEHDRMWTVDSPGEGVIDTPAAPSPTDPGPVLGRGH
jgi:uncharacterized protein YukE